MNKPLKVVEKKLPLSKFQELFWILNKLNKENPMNNTSSVFEIKGHFNITAFHTGVNQLVSRHEILRTNFVDENGSVLQVISEMQEGFLEIPIIEIEENYCSNSVPEKVYDFIQKPFDLQNDALLRVGLFKFKSSESILCIVFHQAITDLRSREIFSKELSEMYNCFVSNLLPFIPESTTQYSDFCTWHNDWLAKEEVEKMLNDWSKEPIRHEEIFQLPKDFEPQEKIVLRGRRKHFILEKNLSKKIKIFSENNMFDLFTTLLAIFSVFLNKISGSSRIIICVPLGNHLREEFRNTLGCFMNIHPVQVDFPDDLNFMNLLKQIRTTLLKTERKQEIPFQLINSDASQDDVASLFQVGFAFEPPMQLHFKDAELIPLAFEREGFQLKLSLTLWEENENFHAHFEYSDQQFKEESVIRFFNIIKTVIRALLVNPNGLISEMNITPEEDIQFIKKWNETNVPYEKNLCIHQKFEQLVKKDPEAPALLSANKVIRYKELNDHVNKLANYLIFKGVTIEDKIGVCVERSIEMIISILGILKAGAAYLPLDPEYPEERLKSIIKDANSPLILVSKSSSIRIPDGTPILIIDNIIEKPYSENSSNPDVKVTSKNLAYVLYTSGSTGEPKGVMIEHHSVLNRIGWMQKAYPIDKNDTLLQKTPITFDVSVWELFWWFFNGSKLVLLPIGSEKDPETLIKYINNYKITIIHFVPSMFAPFLGTLITRNLCDKIASLKRLFLSGENLPLKLVKDFNELRVKYSCPEIINLYGPTEATVDVSYFKCPNKNISKVFIGRPIDNTKLFVVNYKDVIQPIGVQGELIITGVNLARGYLNHDDLTREKFFDFKIPRYKGIKAYRSGDKVKLTSEGELEYIGRLDNQVKIRGFRIELGDVESKILEHPLVSSCAVSVFDKAELNYLIAYVCPKPGVEIRAMELKNYLLNKLPGFMIPSDVVFLNTLPLTISGKLDRKKVQENEKIFSKNNAIASSNKFEKRLFGLWSRLLKKDNISIYDNFFDVGGNSLLAINLVNLIYEEFKIEVKGIAIFKYTTIKDQSEFLKNVGKFDYLSNEIEIDQKIQRKKNVDFKTNRN